MNDRIKKVLKKKFSFRSYITYNYQTKKSFIKLLRCYIELNKENKNCDSNGGDAK